MRLCVARTSLWFHLLRSFQPTPTLWFRVPPLRIAPTLCLGGTPPPQAHLTFSLPPETRFPAALRHRASLRHRLATPAVLASFRSNGFSRFSHLELSQVGHLLSAPLLPGPPCFSAERGYGHLAPRLQSCVPPTACPALGFQSGLPRVHSQASDSLSPPPLPHRPKQAGKWTVNRCWTHSRPPSECLRTTG